MKIDDQKNNDELREEYDLNNLNIKSLGKGWEQKSKHTWAVFIKTINEDFIPLKLYKIEIYETLSKAKVVNEKGQEVFCPIDWFLEINLEKKTTNIFEKVAI